MTRLIHDTLEAQNLFHKGLTNLPIIAAAAEEENPVIIITRNACMFILVQNTESKKANDTSI